MLTQKNMTTNNLFLQLNSHLLEDSNPSVFLNQVSAQPEFYKYPFRMLYAMKDTPQSPKHHPEGSVWNHTMLVVDEASNVKEKSKNPPVFMWAALLHDIGKPPTTKIRKNKITSYDHDTVGAKLADEFLRCFINDETFIKNVSNLVRYHMHILYVLNRLPFGDIQGMLKDVEIEEIAWFGLCDRLGRGNVDRNLEEEQIKAFIQTCKSMKGNDYGKSRNAQAEPKRTSRNGKQPQNPHSKK